MYLFGSHALINGTKFIGNAAGSIGGALFGFFIPELYITNCFFEGQVPDTFFAFFVTATRIEYTAVVVSGEDNTGLRIQAGGRVSIGDSVLQSDGGSPLWVVSVPLVDVRRTLVGSDSPSVPALTCAGSHLSVYDSVFCGSSAAGFCVQCTAEGASSCANLNSG